MAVKKVVDDKVLFVQPPPCDYAGARQERDAFKAAKLVDYDCCMRRRHAGYGTVVDLRYEKKEVL